MCYPHPSIEATGMPVIAYAGSITGECVGECYGVLHLGMSGLAIGLNQCVVSMKLAKGRVRSRSPRRVSIHMFLLSFNASLLSFHLSLA